MLSRVKKQDLPNEERVVVVMVRVDLAVTILSDTTQGFIAAIRINVYEIFGCPYFYSDHHQIDA